MRNHVPAIILAVALHALTGSVTAQNAFADALADALDAVTIQCDDEAHAALAEFDASDLLYTYDRLACFEVDGSARLVRMMIDLEAEQVGAETVGSWDRNSDGSLQRWFAFHGTDFDLYLAPVEQDTVQYVEISRARVAEQEGEPRTQELAGLYEEALGGHRGDCLYVDPARACTFVPGDIQDVLARIEGTDPPDGVSNIEPGWMDGPPDIDTTMYSAIVEFAGHAYIVTLVSDDVLWEGEVYLDVGSVAP